jgi:hypothetical protein
MPTTARKGNPCTIAARGAVVRAISIAQRKRNAKGVHKRTVVPEVRIGDCSFIGRNQCGRPFARWPVHRLNPWNSAFPEKQGRSGEGVKAQEKIKSNTPKCSGILLDSRFFNSLVSLWAPGFTDFGSIFSNTYGRSYRGVIGQRPERTAAAVSSTRVSKGSPGGARKGLKRLGRFAAISHVSNPVF